MAIANATCTSSPLITTYRKVYMYVVHIGEASKHNRDF